MVLNSWMAWFSEDKKMKHLFRKIIRNNPSLELFLQLFSPRLKAIKGDLQSVHDQYRSSQGANTTALDLGCGLDPSNRFGATEVFGIDLHENQKKRILKCRLGFERLPFPDEYFDYVTAYDLLEHIPRYSDIKEIGHTPFIFLMNETYRVLKKGGKFVSSTPIYPYLGAFQDPTHNNIMTEHTFEYYFSQTKFDIAKHYGINTDYEILHQGMLGQHLVAVLQK